MEAERGSAKHTITPWRTLEDGAARAGSNVGMIAALVLSGAAGCASRLFR